LLQRGGNTDEGGAERGVRKIPRKSPKSPLLLIALRKVDVIIAVTLAAPACDQHNPYCFHRVSASGGKADMVRSEAVILKISLRTCEGGLRFAEQTNFGPYPLEPKVAGNSWRAQSQQWRIRRQLALIRKLVRVPIAFNQSHEPFKSLDS
jgi:hypothetical protein